MLTLAFNPISHGWWPAARRVPSPNHNDRPVGTDINALVIHNISLPPGQFGGGYIEQFFGNQLDSSIHPYFASIAALQVSAHCLIDRRGHTIQFVSFDQRAWHAGRSSLAGVVECNDYSIGVELEGVDDRPYTASQYQMLVKLTRDLMRRYPSITFDRIVGHSDVAPGRKTDPGPAFDWSLYRELLRASVSQDNR